MVSGTYILTDTIKAAFTTVFTDVYKHTDAVITGKSAIGNDNGNGNGPGERRRCRSRCSRASGLCPALPRASGSITDQSGLVGRNGKVLAVGGAPGLAFSYDPSGQRFNPLTLTSGNWPTAPDEVDIDASTANKEELQDWRAGGRRRARA